MAITKIIKAIHPPTKGNTYKVLKNTIDYVLKPEKTDNGRLIGSINCFTDTALQEMKSTHHRYGVDQLPFGTSERLGYHFTISFSPEEKIEPETALQVIKEFTEEFLGNRYEVVYSVHRDTENLHGHICFNSVNLRTGRKFRYEKGDWAKYIQPLTDKICQKHGLHTLEMDTGKTILEYEAERKQKEREAFFAKLNGRNERNRKRHSYHKDSKQDYNWNEHLRLLLDDIVLHSKDMDEFYKQLAEREIDIKQGESQVHGSYIGLKAPGMEIHRKTYQLGKEYTLESLKKRVEMVHKPLPEFVIPEEKMLVIPMKYFSHTRKKMNHSPEMKRYFRRLYQLGVRPRRVRVTYQDIKRTRMYAEQMKKELDMVLRYHIGSGATAAEAVKACRRESAEAKALMVQVKQKHADYDMLLKNYRWYKKLKAQSELSLGTDKELQEVLEKARVSFEKYGFTEEMVEDYIRQRKAELTKVLKDYRETVENVKLAEKIAAEYVEEKELDYELSREELEFLNSIPEEEQKKEERKEHLERRLTQ